ncbi:MAG: hypothetical protein H0W74_09825 [Sphingosinicella sp.]|nr:hypothetical protein [Sphingosinicella sp.]
MKRTTGFLLALAFLAACGENQTPDSGVTVEEAAALDETENMLDAPSEGQIAEETGNSGDPLVTGDEATNAH